MYNNPFIYQSMYRPGILSRLFGNVATRGVSSGISFGNILSTTQKSLNVINQVIPIVNQVKPMVNNAKAMFKIADILKSDDSITKTSIKKEEGNITSSNKPIFYI